MRRGIWAYNIAKVGGIGAYGIAKVGAARIFARNRLTDAIEHSGICLLGRSGHTRLIGYEGRDLDSLFPAMTHLHWVDHTGSFLDTGTPEGYALAVKEYEKGAPTPKELSL